MNWEILIRIAGCGLLLIAAANFFLPAMLDYAGNLGRVDRMFGQVFKVHCVYTMVTVSGMGLLCLWKPGFFLEHEVGRGLAVFYGLFWGSRFLIQVFYYDRSVRAKYRFWDYLFGAGFLGLGGGFLTIALLP